IASTIMMAVLTALGLVAWPSGLWVIPVAAVAGAMFAALGLIITSITKNISSFNVPMFLMIIPMFTFSGTFFPVSILPRWAFWVAWCLPLTHVSNLVRASVLGWWRGPIVVSAIYVVVLAAALSALALRLMKRRLIQWAREAGGPRAASPWRLLLQRLEPLGGDSGRLHVPLRERDGALVVVLDLLVRDGISRRVPRPDRFGEVETDAGGVLPRAAGDVEGPKLGLRALQRFGGDPRAVPDRRDAESLHERVVG